MSENKQYRVLFASDTPGHTAGYYVVARALRDAGFEVITTGEQLPEQAAAAALQEDSDILAYRLMDRDPIAAAESLLLSLRQAGISQLPVLIGGIINRREVKQLESMGIAGVFPPGSRLVDIVKRAHECVGEEYQEATNDFASSRR